MCIGIVRVIGEEVIMGIVITKSRNEHDVTTVSARYFVFGLVLVVVVVISLGPELGYQK